MRILFLSFFLAISILSYGQEVALLTINDESISVNEFKRVYEKNLNLIEQDAQSDPEDYLELFIDYKLKVQEAYKLGLHQNESYIKELQSYRSQLAKEHLKDVAVTDALVKEAYYRIKKELKARHILIRVAPDASPIDTLKAYMKISALRSRIINGEDFNTVARRESEDPSAKTNGGDLGWFKAFKMVYPFENAAYATSINGVSRPFRTSFGYHIVQPTDERLAKGSVKVAHIMISLVQPDTTLIPEKRINTVDSLLNTGVSFEALARSYSDDSNSAKKGGILNAFEQGQLSSTIFEKKAFELDTLGQITAPFKTKFGWHIVKLLEKNPIGTFVELKPVLTQKVTKDARSKVLDVQLKERLRNRYNIGDSKDIVRFFKDVFPEVKAKDLPELSAIKGINDKAIVIADTTITFNEIGSFLVKQYNRVGYKSRDQFLEENVDKYIDTTLKSYHLEHLEEQDETFALILKEYKEGLLLFDLLQNKIWDRAQNDSIGLKEYYQSRAEDYKTPLLYEAKIYSTAQRQTALELNKLLKNGLSSEDALDLLKDKGPILVSTDRLKESDMAIEEDTILPLGLTEIVQRDDQYLFYDIIAVVPPAQMTLEESRGQVMSDYQKLLEKEFTEEIRSRSRVTINQKALSNLKLSYE